MNEFCFSNMLYEAKPIHNKTIDYLVLNNSFFTTCLRKKNKLIIFFCKTKS